MDTLGFLQKILPQYGNFYLVLFTKKLNDRGQPFKDHKPYSDLEDMAEAVARWEKDSRYTAVYHACGSYRTPYIELDELNAAGKPKKKFRVHENTYEAKSFWMDIDVGQKKADEGKGYATKQDAVAALSKFTKQIGWPMPMLVSSGYGVHAYWPLIEEIPADRWGAIASWLKSASMHFKFLADPTRTADFASILRPVGAMNTKNPESPKQVKVMKDAGPFDVDELEQALMAAVDEHDVKKSAERKSRQDFGGLNDDLIAHLDNFPKLECSARAVADHCAQVAAMRDTKGDVGYDHWRGVIGLISQCVEGVDLAHEWSELREATGHSNCDVETRFVSWNAKATTCEFFALHNPTGCDGCGHKGKVTSPIVLGRIAPEQTEEQVVEAKSAETGEIESITVPPLPQGYLWDNKHMVRTIVNKDGILEPWAFCGNLFYPTMRIRKEDTTFDIGIRMHLPDGRVREFEIPFEALASNTDLMRSFAKYELIQSNHKDAGVHMHAYLRDAMERLKREVEEVNTMTTFGWKNDLQSFLIGDRLYGKDGSVRRVLLGGYAAGKKDLFPAPKGTLEGYTKPLNYIYNREGLLPLQYALCAGWGSILSAFCEDTYKGLMFSLYSGKSGTGKSTVCYNSLYAFGMADAMALKSEDMGTKNALYARLGAFNNIPTLFDEMTKVDPKDLSDMAYRISLGQERDRMTVRGGGVKFADTATWRMSPFVTSNTNLHALLSTTMANSEAEQVRVVQIDLDQYALPVYEGADLQAFQMACDQIKHNVGVAGDAMIRYCVTHVNDLYDRVRKKVLELARHVPEPKFRFYRSHAACTMVMAEIAKELGIIEFDVADLGDFAVALMKKLKTNLTLNTVNTPDDAYHRMLSALASRIVVTNEYRDGRNLKGPETPRRPIMGEVVGRWVVPNQNVKDPASGHLMLVAKEVRDWCSKNRLEYSDIVDYLRGHDALRTEHERVNLVRGTDVAGGQAWCMIIDTTKLEDVGLSSSPVSLVVNNEQTLATGTAG